MKNFTFLGKKVFYFFLRWLYTFWMPDVRVLSIDDSIEFVLKYNKSIIRWGDGETELFDGYDIVYQRFDKNLRAEMLSFVTEYSDDSPYVIGVPTKYLAMKGLSSVLDKKCRRHWLRTRKDFKKFFNHNVYYMNAFIFGKGLEKKYERLWKEKDYCIFLHNEEQYAKSFEGKYQLKTFYIEVASRDAYSHINTYETSILQRIENEKLDLRRLIVLVSAGPAAKALAFRLSKKGVMTIDAGHCWDYPLNPELSHFDS